MLKLLDWQEENLKNYATNYHVKPSYTVVAGTGAGKTLAGVCMIEHAMLQEKGTNPIVLIVCPYRSIKPGWEEWASAKGFEVTKDNTQAGDPDLDVIVCTYASAGSMLSMLYEDGRPVILVLDEFHHICENKAWAAPYESLTIGDGNPVVRAILLSGTPWREKGIFPTTLVSYTMEGEKFRVNYDYLYTYGDALKEDDANRNVVPAAFKLEDGVAHQELFDKVSGEVVGKNAYDTQTMAKGDPLTPFVDFSRESIHSYDAVVKVVDRSVNQLRMLRSSNNTTAVGGLAIVMGRQQAQALKHYLQEVHQINAVVVTSDDPKAHAAIDTFRTSHDQSWLIAVDMVSEGVDVPRIKVIADLTNKRTMLHIIQRWGRALRRMRKNDGSFATNPAAMINAINHPMLRFVVEDLEKEIQEAMKEASSGDGDAPDESTVGVQTVGQDSNGHVSYIHGEERDTDVHDLALWLWQSNYQEVQAYHSRGHTELYFFARSMMLENRVPEDYTETKEAPLDKKPRTHDQKKKAASDTLNTAFTKMAADHFDLDYRQANNTLNKEMGITYPEVWKWQSQTIGLIKERTKLANTYNQTGGWC